MTSQAETEALLQLERQFWEAMQRKDGPAAARMTADACIITGAQGVGAVDPVAMERLTAEGQWTLQSYDFDAGSVRVRMIDADTGVIAYSVTERLIVGGEPLTLKAHDSSVWVRRDGGWVCVLHTESVAGDPFGRDRVASG
jgi:hypothetical protein